MWDASFNPQKKSLHKWWSFDMRHEEKGKEEGWGSVLGLARTTQGRVLVKGWLLV